MTCNVTAYASELALPVYSTSKLAVSYFISFFITFFQFFIVFLSLLLRMQLEWYCFFILYYFFFKVITDTFYVSKLALSALSVSSSLIYSTVIARLTA